MTMMDQHTPVSRALEENMVHRIGWKGEKEVKL